MVKLKTLYKTNNKNATQQVDIEIVGDTYVTTWGQIDGKKQSKTTKCFSKNVGKKNETTDEEQALKEAQAKHREKIERKGFSLDKSGKVNIELAMKISDYTKRTKSLLYPQYVSVKYNGLNGLFIYEDNTLTLVSRTAKSMKIPEHLITPVSDLMSSLDITRLNAELYIHNTPLQDITGCVSKHNELTKALQVIIFDIPDYTTFEDTIKVLQSIKDTDYIKIAETRLVNSLEELTEYYNKVVSNKYEGVVIKAPDSPYIFGTRSTTRFKWKPLEDAEFKVVGYNLDKNGQVVLEMLTDEGNAFKVKPKGTVKERQDILDNINDYLGRHIKVYFEMLSKSNIPLKPVTSCEVRDD